MAEEIELRTPHLRLAARAWGPQDGDPVLALHGWLDNAASFERLAPLLPLARVVALDLPGHGRSAHRPPGTHYHFVDFVPDVIAAADALGWERSSLLGHSLGAGIASFVAAVAPERIERVALIEGLGPLSGPPEDAPDRLTESMRRMARVDPRRLSVYADVDAAARAREKATGMDHEAALVLARRGTRETEGGVTWSSDPKLLVTSPLYLTEEQVGAFLGRIEAPVLLLLSRSGSPRAHEYVARRRALVPTLDVRILDGGHHLHLEHPEPVAGALREFLDPETTPVHFLDRR